MDTIIAKLKNQGYRITKSRLALIELFYQNKEEHFTTDELIDILKQDGYKVNVMSLYNNLKILIQEKLIQESVFKGKKVYEFTNGFHIHFYCKNCSKHIDLIFDEIYDHNKDVENKFNFIIENVKIEYTGLCKECIKGEGNESCN